MKYERLSIFTLGMGLAFIVMSFTSDCPAPIVTEDEFVKILEKTKK